MTTPSGLFAVDGEAAGEPIPLEGVSVEATIRDYGARVVVSQRYRNLESRPIEAVYKFPLDEGAAVCGFEAEIDGRRLSGRVEEREKAFAVYDDALAAGHGSYLLDEERADVFTASVGNLPPGQSVVLRITTVSELPLEGDAIRFTLPTTISPRYAPAEDRAGVGPTEAERVSPPYALQVPYGLSLAVDVETSAALRSVESPTHPIAVELDGRRAKVRLSARETALDGDFVLKIALGEAQQPHALVERGADGAAYALLSFRPRFEAKAVPSEVVFLVDRSGSMQGTSIAEARNALQLCLRSLRPGSFFNVVGFGSRCQALFPESRPYDDASLAAASAHVRQLEADLGGTELLPALELVLGAKPREGMVRQLFVLTDGELSNTDAVIELARRHASHARVFTFGIGAGASHHLVKGLARAGEGEAEFIAPGERVEGKVLRQLSRALSAALTDVTVDWGGLAVEQAPHLAPPVFDGGRVLVFARLDAPQPATVRLKAKGPDGALELALSIEPSSAVEGSLLATLWARRRIRDLEEGVSALHLAHGSRQERAKPSSDLVKDAVVRLGTAYGLVSRYTSYVAVEEREAPVAGEPALRKVKVAITRGWHGIGVPGLADGAGLPQLAARAACRSISGPDAPVRVLASAADGFARSRRAMAPPRPADGRPGDRLRPLDRLVALQSADGSWDLTPGLAAAIGLAPQALVSARQAAGPAGCDPRRLHRSLATALALAWLERECSESADEWRLVAQKAVDWLEQSPPGAQFWREAVAGMLTPALHQA